MRPLSVATQCLCYAHIAAGTGEPFPSDLLTALVAVDAKIVYLDVSGPKQLPLETCLVQELVERVIRTPRLAARIVLIRYQVPCGEAGDIVLPQKVALREVNAHSIVNAASRLHLSADLVPRNSVLVFGGIAPFPWRAKETERAMAGTKLSLPITEVDTNSSERSACRTGTLGRAHARITLGRLHGCIPR